MKTYTAASDDLETHINRMRTKCHQDLEHVTIGALFILDTDKGLPCLKLAGYPCAAIVKITSLRERASGSPDAVIIVDQATWFTLKAEQRAALIDHELTHLERCRDKKTQQRLVDAIDRPKLRMRRHDHQFGWFDDVAERHGEASFEVHQAMQLFTQARQLYFSFEPVEAAH